MEKSRLPLFGRTSSSSSKRKKQPVNAVAAFTDTTVVDTAEVTTSTRKYHRDNSLVPSNRPLAENKSGASKCSVSCVNPARQEMANDTTVSKKIPALYNVKRDGKSRASMSEAISSADQSCQQPFNRGHRSLPDKLQRPSLHGNNTDTVTCIRNESNDSIPIMCRGSPLPLRRHVGNRRIMPRRSCSNPDGKRPTTSTPTPNIGQTHGQSLSTMCGHATDKVSPSNDTRKGATDESALPLRRDRLYSYPEDTECDEPIISRDQYKHSQLQHIAQEVGRNVNRKSSVGRIAVGKHQVASSEQQQLCLAGLSPGCECKSNIYESLPPSPIYETIDQVYVRAFPKTLSGAFVGPCCGVRMAELRATKRVSYTRSHSASPEPHSLISPPPLPPRNPGTKLSTDVGGRIDSTETLLLVNQPMTGSALQCVRWQKDGGEIALHQRHSSHMAPIVDDLYTNTQTCLGSELCEENIWNYRETTDGDSTHLPGCDEKHSHGGDPSPVYGISSMGNVVKDTTGVAAFHKNLPDLVNVIQTAADRNASTKRPAQHVRDAHTTSKDRSNHHTLKSHDFGSEGTTIHDRPRLKMTVNVMSIEHCDIDSKIKLFEQCHLEQNEPCNISNVCNKSLVARKLKSGNGQRTTASKKQNSHKTKTEISPASMAKQYDTRMCGSDEPKGHTPAPSKAKQLYSERQHQSSRSKHSVAKAKFKPTPIEDETLKKESSSPFIRANNKFGSNRQMCRKQSCQPRAGRDDMVQSTSSNEPCSSVTSSCASNGSVFSEGNNVPLHRDPCRHQVLNNKNSRTVSVKQLSDTSMDDGAENVIRDSQRQSKPVHVKQSKQHKLPTNRISSFSDVQSCNSNASSQSGRPPTRSKQVRAVAAGKTGIRYKGRGDSVHDLGIDPMLDRCAYSEEKVKNWSCVPAELQHQLLHPANVASSKNNGVRRSLHTSQQCKPPPHAVRTECISPPALDPCVSLVVSQVTDDKSFREAMHLDVSPPTISSQTFDSEQGSVNVAVANAKKPVLYSSRLAKVSRLKLPGSANKFPCNVTAESKLSPKLDAVCEISAGGRDGLVAPVSSTAGGRDGLVAPASSTAKGQYGLVAPVSSTARRQDGLVAPVSSTARRQDGLVAPVSSTARRQDGLVAPASSTAKGQYGLVAPASSTASGQDGLVAPVSSRTYSCAVIAERRASVKHRKKATQQETAIIVTDTQGDDCTERYSSLGNHQSVPSNRAAEHGPMLVKPYSGKNREQYLSRGIFAKARSFENDDDSAVESAEKGNRQETSNCDAANIDCRREPPCSYNICKSTSTKTKLALEKQCLLAQATNKPSDYDEATLMGCQLDSQANSADTSGSMSASQKAIQDCDEQAGPNCMQSPVYKRQMGQDTPIQQSSVTETCTKTSAISKTDVYYQLIDQPEGKSSEFDGKSEWSENATNGLSHTVGCVVRDRSDNVDCHDSQNIPPASMTMQSGEMTLPGQDRDAGKTSEVPACVDQGCLDDVRHGVKPSPTNLSCLESSLATECDNTKWSTESLPGQRLETEDVAVNVKDTSQVNSDLLGNIRLSESGYDSWKSQGSNSTTCGHDEVIEIDVASWGIFDKKGETLLQEPDAILQQDLSFAMRGSIGRVWSEACPAVSLSGSEDTLTPERLVDSNDFGSEFGIGSFGGSDWIVPKDQSTVKSTRQRQCMDVCSSPFEQCLLPSHTNCGATQTIAGSGFDASQLSSQTNDKQKQTAIDMLFNNMYLHDDNANMRRKETDKQLSANECNAMSPVIGDRVENAKRDATTVVKLRRPRPKESHIAKRPDTLLPSTPRIIESSCYIDDKRTENTNESWPLASSPLCKNNRYSTILSSDRVPCPVLLSASSPSLDMVEQEREAHGTTSYLLDEATLRRSAATSTLNMQRKQCAADVTVETVMSVETAVSETSIHVQPSDKDYCVNHIDFEITAEKSARAINEAVSEKLKLVADKNKCEAHVNILDESLVTRDAVKEDCRASEGCVEREEDIRGVLSQPISRRDICVGVSVQLPVRSNSVTVSPSSHKNSASKSKLQAPSSHQRVSRLRPVTTAVKADVATKPANVANKHSTKNKEPASPGLSFQSVIGSIRQATVTLYRKTNSRAVSPGDSTMHEAPPKTLAAKKDMSQKLATGLATKSPGNSGIPSAEKNATKQSKLCFTPKLRMRSGIPSNARKKAISTYEPSVCEKIPLRCTLSDPSEKQGTDTYNSQIPPRSPSRTAINGRTVPTSAIATKGGLSRISRPVHPRLGTGKSLMKLPRPSDDSRR